MKIIHYLLPILIAGISTSQSLRADDHYLPKDKEELNILVYGASGLLGLSKVMPEIASLKHEGQKVNVQVLSQITTGFVTAMEAAEGGKRAPEGYAEGVEGMKDISELEKKGNVYGYVNWEDDRKVQLHILDEINSKDWDAIILTLNTSGYINPDAYKLLDTMVEFSQKHCPEAKLYLWQRMYPSNDAPHMEFQQKRLISRGKLPKDTTLTDDLWIQLSSQYCSQWLAEHPEYDITLIPAGDVSYWVMEDERWNAPEFPTRAEALKIFEQLGPDEIPEYYQGKDLLLAGLFNRGGKVTIDHHPGVNGEYVNATVAYHYLFGDFADTTGIRLRGKPIEKDALLNEIVKDVIVDDSKIPLYQN